MEMNDVLCSKLRRLVLSGVVLLLNGDPSSPEEISEAVKRKSDNYFMKFLYSRSGSLSGLNYIRIA